ncbi:MAG: hypothetical protein ACPGVB_02260 [Chitinophagales bacterium]
MSRQSELELAEEYFKEGSELKIKGRFGRFWRGWGLCCFVQTIRQNI